MGLGWILVLTFCFMVFFVGGYMFMMLNVMRVDPREQKFRDKHEETTNTIIPKKVSTLKSNKK